MDMNLDISGGYRRRGYESSVSVKGGEFLGWPSDYFVLKKISAPWR
jgi:hypothetical protein